MKKVLVTMIAVLASSFIANAGQLQCAASVETVKGSGQYDKMLFFELVQAKTQNMVFVLPNGTILKQKEVKPEMFDQIVKGTLAIWYSLEDNKASLMVAKVKQDASTLPSKELFEDMAFAQTPDSFKVLLMAHGVFTYCSEI
ncbi:MAG: hypothetical protein JNM24_09535 [Bdellovibrionaceae bacterium]|nr:hypothetical protein [Pseudobdellovibrionaceae bacterium]